MQTLFIILALISVLSALGVVLFAHPLYSAFCLILNMFTIAGYFAMLEAHFLAAAQIIVYAGAIMVLVVFVIMLLSLGAEERWAPNILITVFAAIGAAAFIRISLPIMSGLQDTLGKTSSSSIGANVVVGDVTSLGRQLFTEQLFAFELASVLITAAIVGAVMLAKRHHSALSSSQSLKHNVSMGNE